MKTALDYSRSTVEAAPEQVHFRWNVAFIQTQMATLILSLPDASRTLADVEATSVGLEEAIESLQDIAQAPNPPFPKHDIEQRVNMGRNTMRKQLEKSLQSQREYEGKNAARLDQARKQREAELEKRETERRAVEEKAEEQRKKLREERERMMEEDRLIALSKAEEEQARERAELTTDEETGEKKKREKKKASKRKKKGEESDTDPDVTDRETSGRKSKGRSTSATPSTGAEGEERPKKKKRRKLERKSKVTSSKYKSEEKIVDSDSDDEAVATMNENARLAGKLNGVSDDEEEAASPNADQEMADGNDEDRQVAQRRRNKPTRILDEDEDEDEEGGDEVPASAPNGSADVPMVDESGPAAGNEDAGDS